MNALKPKIHDETSGLDYVVAGDYYIPAIELPEGEDRPVGKWGADAQSISGRNESSSDSIVSRAEETIRSEIVNA